MTVFSWLNQPNSDTSPRQVGVILALGTTVGLAFIWMSNSQRTKNNIREFCAEKYQLAHSAVDSAKVDRYQVVPPSRFGRGVVCGDYRGAK